MRSLIFTSTRSESTDSRYSWRVSRSGGSPDRRASSTLHMEGMGFAAKYCIRLSGIILLMLRVAPNLGIASCLGHAYGPGLAARLPLDGAALPFAKFRVQRLSEFKPVLVASQSRPPRQVLHQS